MAYTFTRTGAQIEEIHNTVEDPKSNSQFSDDIRTIAGEYRGLWPDTGGSANKGDTYQTQVGGTPTGEYYTALQNTSVDPVGDNVNWKANNDYGSVSGDGLVVKHRRGTAAEIAAGTPAIGEIVMDTDNNELVLGDGTTQGGHPIPKKKATVLKYSTVAAMIADNTLKAGQVVKTSGYYNSDGIGAGEYLIVASATVDGKGSFELNNGLFAVLQSQPTLDRFGGASDGGVTPSVNAASLEALLVHSTTYGVPVYSGVVKNCAIDRGVVVELDKAFEFHGTEDFTIVYNSNIEDAVKIKTPDNVSKSRVYIDHMNVKGGRYGITVEANTFGDNLLNTISNVTIKHCRISETYLSGILTYHVINADISHNFFFKCGDNGVYASFSAYVNCSHNIAYNCRGSAGMTVGYSDTIRARGNQITNCIIWNDDGAASVPTAAAPSSLGGVWMGNCSDGLVQGNTIYNGATVTAASLKSGIWTDENTIDNVTIEGNVIVGVSEVAIRVGTLGGTIEDVYVRNNTIKYCRDGIRIEFGVDVYVENNTIKFTGQRGIYALSGVKNVVAKGNTLLATCQQGVFNTFYSIELNSDRSTIIDNYIDDTMSRIVLVDPSGTVTVKIDNTLTGIEVYINSVLNTTITVNIGSSIWGDIYSQIIAITELSGSLFVGNPDQVIESLKRTGPPTVDFSVEIDADGYILSFAPAYGYIKSSNGEVRNNLLRSEYLNYPDQNSYFYNNRKPLSINSLTNRDTNDWGGGRSFIGAATPTEATRYYRQGDIISDKIDGGTFAERCTVSGAPGTWVTA